MNNSSDELRAKLANRTVVADTSALLMDGVSLLNRLEGVDLVIPAIVVSELEGNRKDPQVGVFAREWIRFFDEVCSRNPQAMATGAPIPGGSTVRIEPNHRNQESLPEWLRNGSHDSTIMAVAVNLSLEDESLKPILLTNDTPMRLHALMHLGLEAAAVGSTASGYVPYSGRVEVELTGEEYTKHLDRLGNYLFTRVQAEHPELAHAILDVSVDGELLDESFHKSPDRVAQIGFKLKASKLTARTAEQNAALTYLRASADELPIVSIGGNAGTGKTLMTIAAALDEYDAGNYEKILVFRSLHEMGKGQEMGFLPGGVDEKIAPWAGAVCDALDVIALKDRKIKSRSSATDGQYEAKREEASKKLRDKIEISPITYLRGRSIASAYIILEEAQNFSRTEILNILSRAGVGSKIVLTFDAQQVDSRFLPSGPRAEVWSVIETLKSSSLFAHVTLQKTERSKVAELASSILADDGK